MSPVDLSIPPIVTPTPVVINAVQFTPDRQPVLIQYAGHEVSSGPLAGRQMHHTTQAVLEARSGIPGSWGDAECKAELAAHLAEHGIAAVIVDNLEPVALPDPATEVAPA
jgi:hypothetical protein